MPTAQPSLQNKFAPRLRLGKTGKTKKEKKKRQKKKESREHFPETTKPDVVAAPIRPAAVAVRRAEGPRTVVERTAPQHL